ncbi:DUF2971 domain-containing protein [Paeniglutamicibacter gangotriensis]|uniref:DUF2971 domain-containing protein n=1 Tax=Paeniglutamicibacter gangotriensis Lz1y TaxID=1276920 RepID=M7MWX3_9MICC|nr:DUF2971 domain-containing protein [Paeniglutamicibacter gangotriensis]EMQ99566.1 hypothetical protein ADIAG_00666 [Paeniglutamicibacter gangotriensis Lz1y]
MDTQDDNKKIENSYLDETWTPEGDDDWKPNEGLIWHYTNGHALGNVLGKHELWASSTAFMNDREERQLADKYLVSAKKKHGLELPWELGESGHWAEEHTFYGQSNERFLLSASRNGDSLSMWRGYAGTGSQSFAIGLEPSAELCILDPSTGDKSARDYVARFSPWALDKWWGEDIYPDVSGWFPVVYDQDKSKNLAENAIKYLADALTGHRAFESDIDAGHLYDAAYDTTEKLRNRIKHHGFQDENEVRIVASADTPLLKFRSGRWGMIPYIVLTGVKNMGENKVVQNPYKLPIREIRMSPTPVEDQQSSRRSLEALLKSNGYQDVKVSVSETPFRE